MLEYIILEYLCSDVIKFWKLVAHPGQWLTDLGGSGVRSGDHGQWFSANDMW